MRRALRDRVLAAGEVIDAIVGARARAFYTSAVVVVLDRALERGDVIAIYDDDDEREYDASELG